MLVFCRQVTLVLIDFDTKLKSILFNHMVYLRLSRQISFKVFNLLVDEVVVFLERKDVLENLS